MDIGQVKALQAQLQPAVELYGGLKQLHDMLAWVSNAEADIKGLENRKAIALTSAEAAERDAKTRIAKAQADADAAVKSAGMLMASAERRQAEARNLEAEAEARIAEVKALEDRAHAAETALAKIRSKLADAGLSA